MTPSRQYKDGAEWKSSDSYNQDDLLNLAKVAERTEAFIAQKMAEDRGRAAA